VDSTIRSADVHTRWCANRSMPTAIGFVTFCVLGAVLAWRVLGQEGVAHRTTALFGDLIVITVLAQVFAKFSCVRERLVLGLLILRFGVAFVAKVAPALFGETGYLVRRASFGLWVLALAVSLSMLYSALRFRSRPRPAR
jgi:hypothetical protein